MSDMIHIVDVIEKIVEQRLRQLYLLEIGIVTEVFPHEREEDYDNYSCNVRLKNPDKDGSFLELHKVPIATCHVGTVAIPNVGDMVLISFVQGSPHQPIIVSRLYHSEMRPPLNKADEIITQLPPGPKPDEKIIHMCMANHQEDDGPRSITLSMSPLLRMSAVVEREEAQFTVELNNKVTQLRMAHRQQGEIEIASQDTKITLRENGDVTISTPQNITIKAEKKLTLEAESIEMKSKKDTKLSAGRKLVTKSESSQKHQAGQSMQINAGTTTKIDAQGAVMVKGKIVDIN